MKEVKSASQPSKNSVPRKGELPPWDSSIQQPEGTGDLEVQPTQQDSGKALIKTPSCFSQEGTRVKEEVVALPGDSVSQ